MLSFICCRMSCFVIFGWSLLHSSVLVLIYLLSVHPLWVSILAINCSILKSIYRGGQWKAAEATLQKHTCWMWKIWKHFEISVNTFVEFFCLDLIDCEVVKLWPGGDQWLALSPCCTFMPRLWFMGIQLSNKRVVPMKEFIISHVYVHNCLVLVWTTVVLPGTRNSLCWCRTGVWCNTTRIHSGWGTVSISTVLSVVAFGFGLGLTWKLLKLE